MDKIYYITLLLDFYGELLTCKQKSVMSRYYFDDCSLNEIAEEHSITRQAVQDMIKRTEKLLKQYEDKLLLVDKYLKRREYVEGLLTELDSLIEKGNSELVNIKDLVKNIPD
ncbi:MAG: putative DNA-binding protein [Clostridia bacterium]|nr:putative DNA-binding protein [Clostridia bacterium]